MTDANREATLKKYRFNVNELEMCLLTASAFIHPVAMPTKKNQIVRILLINSCGVFFMKEFTLHKIVVTALLMVTQPLVAAHEKRWQTCFKMTAGGGGEQH